MRAVDLIVKKREGGTLEAGELEFLVGGYVAGEIPDYQLSALLMAIYFQGMSPRETADLTGCMLRSGRQYDLSSLAGPKIDKHSTGGVGDKVSLVVAPVLASLGVTVPMMSGRGLGHTGGTLDKLEAIPGFRTGLEEEEFRRCLAKAGYAMIGQSEQVVPADRKLYALRDVTGTVESIPLITASILSKKCAEGAEGFVFDVKCGSGAFMKTPEQARALAEGLVGLGRELGRKTKAVISAMDQPLGLAAGNFLEVREAVEVLQNGGPADLREICLRLAGWMLVLAGKEAALEPAITRCRQSLESGGAWERFLANVAAQGGDCRVVEDPVRGPRARHSEVFSAPEGGYLARLDAHKVGLATGLLGAGRAKKEDAVSPGAGILLSGKCGDPVQAGQPLCTFFTDDPDSLPAARRMFAAAIRIQPEPVETQPLILAEI